MTEMPRRPHHFLERKLQHKLAILIADLEPIISRVAAPAKHVDAHFERRLIGVQKGRVRI